jgi:hypothetical protein
MVERQRTVYGDTKMATYISIHDAKTIRASTVQDHNDCSPHITFEFDGDATTCVTVYLPNAEFNQRLIDLINEAARAVPVDAPKYSVPEAEDDQQLPF